MAVIFEKDKHIARVGINIPETRNALDPDTLYELYQIWDECQNDNNVRVVVLYSALPNIFCSGMDLRSSIPVWTRMREPQTKNERWLLEDNYAIGKAMLKNKELDRPIIAAINGYCLTGGFEMAMGCEMRIAADNAIFQMRETKLGIMPMSGSNVYLPAQVGYVRALEILLTGDKYSSDKLYEWGFLNKVVSEKDLMNEAMKMAETIAENGPKSIRGMVKMSRMIQGRSIEDALRLEAELGLKVFASEDPREGLRAQKEKRKPIFSSS